MSTYKDLDSKPMNDVTDEDIIDEMVKLYDYYDDVENYGIEVND